MTPQTIEIRTVPREQLADWHAAVEAANSSEASEEAWRDYSPIIEPERTLGAYDGEQLVGGGSIFSFQLTVPGGGSVGAAGITEIGVLPTHRRRGILRQMMARQLADTRAAGEQVAILWASEGSIYQRFGYGLATLAATIDLERERTAFRSAESPIGSVRLIERDEAERVLPPIYEANLARVPGFFSRSPKWWDITALSDSRWARRGFDKKFFALHETDGVADAYSIYHVRQEWDAIPKSELQVIEIMALDGVALREMWRYIFGVDLVARITTRRGIHPKDPLLLMLAEPRRLRMTIRDGMWLRIVDVVGALEARSYSADGSIVIEVRDEFLPAAGGRWRLTSSAGEGGVEATTDEPELLVDAADLAAVYLGAFTLDDLARAGRTDELVPGARARADAMLVSAAPTWCPQVF